MTEGANVNEADNFLKVSNIQEDDSIRREIADVEFAQENMTEGANVNEAVNFPKGSIIQEDDSIWPETADVDVSQEIMTGKESFLINRKDDVFH